MGGRCHELIGAIDSLIIGIERMEFGPRKKLDKKAEKRRERPSLLAIIGFYSQSLDKKATRRRPDSSLSVFTGLFKLIGFSDPTPGSGASKSTGLKEASV